MHTFRGRWIPWIQGQPDLQSDFQDNQGSIEKPCPKRTTDFPGKSEQWLLCSPPREDDSTNLRHSMAIWLGTAPTVRTGVGVEGWTPLQ